MRFNKQELIAIATQPGNKFEKEGVLFVTERQEGFFRRTEETGDTVQSSLKCIKFKKHSKRRNTFNCIGGTKVSLEKWCRVRGNLLFYFKTNDPFSEPQGCIVLEKYKVVINNYKKEHDGYAFFLEFEDGLKQRLAANTEYERAEWHRILSLASYDIMRAKLKYLREQIEKNRGIIDMDIDINMLRLRYGKEIDMLEVPICESSISCDNLLCDGLGLSPNPCVVIHTTSIQCSGWVKYGRTEVVEKSSNPQFLCTLTFRECDGLTSKSIIRFTVYDVREKLSKTAVVLGSAEIALGVIQDTFRLRIPLRNKASTTAGFITIATYTSETDKKLPRSPAKPAQIQTFSHRRSQSLPPKLGVKLFVPPQCKLNLLFQNPSFHSYRFHSGLGGDISVQETMLESQLCFIIPQQLLSIWIMREKELLQEISGMGEMGGCWRNKQMDLLDKHLKLLKDYSQAKQNLQQQNGYFKTSSCKGDEGLEFAPTNLHLSRMWAHNDTLKKIGLLDVMTVGAFTRHSGKTKSGGLVKLLNSMKDSPSQPDIISHKIYCANEAVQSIKQLRKEIVEIMLQLLVLAKSKNPKGMLSLTNEMMTKSRMLLNIWEPDGLVDEAFAFIEKNRIIEDPDNNSLMPMSPFKKITQQLGTLDLKSPELEDFATPMSPIPDLWPAKSQSNALKFKTKSPSSTDINAIANIQNCVKNFPRSQNFQNEHLSQSLPVTCNLKFSETHFDVNGEILSHKIEQLSDNEAEKKIHLASSPVKAEISLIESNNNNETFVNLYDENGYLIDNTANVLGQNGAFLDTKNQNSEFYRPTEEHEPLDITQLNIEASVMCLVSKVKFLCGRCGSPAIRLRNPKEVVPRSTIYQPDVVTNQPGGSTTLRTTTTTTTMEAQPRSKSCSLNNKDLNLALQAVGEVTSNVKKRNLFTDGLDLSATTDWTSELRPSMKKLRTAMDGLLKTARLMHSTIRLQADPKKIGLSLAIMYRRDVCFSQALTSLVSNLMAKLWGTVVTEYYISILCNIGLLAYFEGLLSLYGHEADMFGDMCVAVDDLASCKFTLIRSNINREATESIPLPRVTGSRHCLNVLLPVPESVFCMLPTKETVTFKVTPVFFNIGINENATFAETLGYTRDQHRSNWDNFDRLKHYYIRFKKLLFANSSYKNQSITSCGSSQNSTPSKILPKEQQVPEQVVAGLLSEMEQNLRLNISKNVKILHIAENITRAVYGLRFTSCKSAKDRTSMSVTLEMVRVLENEFHLPSNQIQKILNIIRSEGSRAENCFKNIGLKKYAFNMIQVMALPQAYRPPNGSYGKAET